MTISVVIPVYNEQAILVEAIARLTSFLEAHFPRACEIVIANNASTDRTLEIARQLQQQYHNVTVLHLEQKGRGRALKRAWTESDADIVSYMDVDLSSDLT